MTYKLKLKIRESTFVFSNVYNSDCCLGKKETIDLLMDDVYSFIDELGGIEKFIKKHCKFEWVKE
jgi:hypothetical protein